VYPKSLLGFWTDRDAGIKYGSGEVSRSLERREMLVDILPLDFSDISLTRF
jgi:hypothetical protein